ncbi:MAG: YkoF family thiamine/hydroxymethylpyrimidine-binding protein [Congregibacter sp.]
MILSAELSLYPLRADYVTLIQAFIDKLHSHEGLVISTNAMSTQIQGEHDKVMRAVSETLKASAASMGEQVLVCKFIPLPLEITKKAAV